MIKYYSPNLRISSVMQSLVSFRYEQNLIQYFRRLTGKQHIIITDSCRSALYLTYMSLSRKGEVITSPLTCKAGITPILLAGMIPKYIDINGDTLTMNESQIESAISMNTVAIQAIHFGGNSCNTIEISKIANKYNLLFIEDCAQGYGASFNGVGCGTLADVSCFTLSKNCYGISGGVFATNRIDIFNSASYLLKMHPKQSISLVAFRVVRNLLESYREFWIFNMLLNLALLSKGKDLSIGKGTKSLKRPTKFEISLNWLQVKHAQSLNRIRKHNAIKLISKLLEIPELKDKNNVNINSSYTKLFINCSPNNAIDVIPILVDSGIDAKHLEQRERWSFQEKISSDPKLTVYNSIHDCLISLPLHENMHEKDFDVIKNKLSEVMSNA